MIDVLARLSSEDRRDKARYEWFVETYFPSEYARDDVPGQLYVGLRNSGLHYLSVGRRLALMDGQMDRPMHLERDEHGRRIIRLEEFVRDLRVAVDRWEEDLQQNEALRTRVLERERHNPVFEVVMINVPAVLGGVTMTSVPIVSVASASAAVYPEHSQPRGY